MPIAYSPKAFLRHAPKALLREYLEARGIHPTDEWDFFEAGKVDPLYDALFALPEELQRSIESDFAAIYSMTSSAGIRSMIQEAEDTRPALGLAEKFGRMSDQHEMSFWTFLRQPDVFEVARLMDSIDSVSFTGLPGLPALLDAPDEESNRSFEESLSALYVQEGRGHCCKIEYLRRGSKHFWFAYLSDYAMSKHTFGDDRLLTVRPDRPVFDIVFVFDEKDGTLNISAGRAKKRIPDLQTVFSRSVMGYDLMLDRSKKLVYELNGLLSRDFQFPTEVEDGIEEVRIKSLRCGVLGNPERTLTVSISRKGGVGAVHDFLDDIVSSDRFTTDILSVKQAVLQVIFRPEQGSRRKKPVSFTLSHPDGCSLKYEPKHIIIREYLKKWNLDVSKRSPDIIAVPRIAGQRLLSER